MHTYFLWITSNIMPKFRLKISPINPSFIEIYLKIYFHITSHVKIVKYIHCFKFSIRWYKIPWFIYSNGIYGAKNLTIKVMQLSWSMIVKRWVIKQRQCGSHVRHCTGVASGWTGWTLSRGPEGSGDPNQMRKNLTNLNSAYRLTTQNCFWRTRKEWDTRLNPDLVHERSLSYPVSPRGDWKKMHLWEENAFMRLWYHWFGGPSLSLVHGLRGSCYAAASLSPT